MTDVTDLQQQTPDEATQADMQVVADDADLGINHYVGETDVAVVAFTGIGHGMGAIQQDEFVGSALGADRNHVISIIDRKRSWYSAKGMQAHILDTVLRLKADLGVRRVVTLGNSMGGFGALLFAERFGADTAVAFVPQYTMRNDFAEPRWRPYREQMVEQNLATLGPFLNGKTKAYAFFGADDVRDRMHVRRLRAHCIIDVIEVAGSDHNNLTAFLKREGVLAPLISAMISRDTAEVTRLTTPLTEHAPTGAS
ncbi:MAG: hypothetical protein AAGF79_04915 [Pseudomonadota bacterium]